MAGNQGSPRSLKPRRPSSWPTTAGCVRPPAHVGGTTSERSPRLMWSRHTFFYPSDPMPRRNDAQVQFDALAIEGALLPAEWLGRIAALDAPSQGPGDYATPKGL